MLSDDPHPPDPTLTRLRSSSYFDSSASTVVREGGHARTLSAGCHAELMHPRKRTTHVNTLLNSDLNIDRDEDIADVHRRTPYARDREITLGTTMVLGIFFALAVFAAVCFGLGYSMGAKHNAGTTVLAAATLPVGSSFNNVKPSPGSPLQQSSDLAAADNEFTPKAAAPSHATMLKPALASVADDAGTETLPLVPATAGPRAVLARAAAPVTPTAPTPAGEFVVQVAAVSHQEDADLLLSTLKRRGYSVAVHSQPQDKLLHVQIGPLATRKDAEAMRQRLLGDGFNAIIK
jgi:DedD protein